MREIGLEWVYRLLQEPGRMWRRYVIGNPLFLFRVWRQKRQGATSGPVDKRDEQAPVDSRDEIIHRFTNIQGQAWRHRLGFQFKRLAWRTVVGGAYVVKRLLDIVGSAILLLVLSPVFLGIALAIKLDSPGPLLFKQVRVGRYGEYFTMWKFRSMYVDAEARKQAIMAQNEMAGGVIFKMKNDPRITRIGRFIRRASIDELPQLWNVLMGDMSLVGPRPALPSEVNQYSLAERRRLEAIPGITCIWQVSGRSDIPFDKQVGLDVDYIESQSLWLDIKLLLLTVPAVLLGRGAY
jgi:exopolysaccharide biosynthesis polyprenyl glycosylphosphotransferase